ncbi:MAG: cupin domain-containing protein [Litorilinea sp.]
MSQVKTAELHSLAQGEGPALWFLGLPTYIKATGEQTNGAVGMVEHVSVPVGFESPYHVHHGEDEVFIVTEGEVTFVSGDRRFTGKAGSYTFLPRDIPHGFRVTGDRPATFFLLFTPAGFEQMFIEMGEPTPPAGPPDMEKLMASVAKRNAEILGPLPE